MIKKIFLSIFISAIVSVITTAMIMLIIIKNEGLNSVGIIAIFSIFIVAALIATSYLCARSIIRPIKNIDLAHPVTRKTYAELKPILNSLKRQNGRVNRYRKKLTDSRERISLIIEDMNDGIVIADPKTIVLLCNSAAYKLMGIEKLTEGQSIYALSNEESFRRCIQDAMGGRNSAVILKTESGDRKITASPASISDTLNGIIVFIIDVTEEQALEKMRREFTSNVSHELKTPLTTIYGISDMLANGMVKSDDIEKFGKNIREEAERLIILIDDIVSLSKLDENDMPRDDEDVDLYLIAEETIERLEKKASDKKITSRLIGDHAIITGNRTILSEVIYNLCDNAIKYNKDGGSYTVRVSHTPTKAVITVADTGIGIPQEHIERIFERFYRVDKSHSRKINGTGLGLSIVKHGVLYHKGTVRAVSSENGSVFIIEFPCKCKTNTTPH